MGHIIPNIDELLLALIKQHFSPEIFTQESLQRSLEAFSLFTGNDYRRLKLFLQRVQPLLTSNH